MQCRLPAPSLPLEKPEGRMGFLFSLNSMANSDLTWTHLVSKPDLTLCEAIYSPCLSYIVRIFMCFPVEIICLCCSETCLGTSMLSACTRWDMSEDSHTVHMSPLMTWRSLYSGACECFSEGVVSSPELWLVTGDKLVWLQVNFEWEGRGLSRSLRYLTPCQRSRKRLNLFL